MSVENRHILTRRKLIITGVTSIITSLVNTSDSAPKKIKTHATPEEIAVIILNSPDEQLDDKEIFTLNPDRILADTSEITDSMQQIGFKQISGKGESLRYRPAIPIDGTARDRFYSQLEAVNGVLPQNAQIKNVQLYPLQNYITLLNDKATQSIFLSGAPREQQSAIAVEVYPNHPVRLSEIELLVFHEMMHVFQHHTSLSSFGWGDSNYVGYLGIFNKHLRKLTDQAMLKMAREGASEKEIADFRIKLFGNAGDELLGSLFNLFDESSYYSGSTGGHPYSNPGELFVSTLTVFRFFPKSFLSSLDANPRYKILAEAFARYTMQFFINNASDAIKAKALFNSELLKHLKI